MAICKNCGKPLIPKGGKCVYCGSDVNDAIKSVDPIRYKWMADFVFCLDCSCSMLHVLDSIKENIAKFIEEIETLEYKRINWRARVMGYRNFDVDEEYLMNDNPFVSSTEELKKQLEGMEAKGYAEKEPCSTLDAIWYATKKSDWRKKCIKLVVVFTDNSPKPINEKTIKNIPCVDDDIEILAEELSVNHIKLLLWGSEHPTYEFLLKNPMSDIILFKDPIDFYYHKAIDMSTIFDAFPDPEEEISDDYVL